jgi:hypothetical protein
MNWLKRALSEPNGTPSSQRVFLLILLVFTLDLIACGFYAVGRLPEIPTNLSVLLQWLFSSVVAGIGTGKIAAALGGKNEPPA